MDDVLSAHSLHEPSSSTSLLVLVSPLADQHQVALARIALSNGLRTIAKDDRFSGIFDGAADSNAQAIAGVVELERCRLETVPNADRKSAIVAIERALQSEVALILYVGQTTVPFGHWMLRNGIIGSNHLVALLGAAGRPAASRCTFITSSPCEDWRSLEKKMASSFSLLTYSFDDHSGELDSDTSHVADELCRQLLAQSPPLGYPDPKSVCAASGRAPAGIASTSGRSASLYLFQDRGSGAVPTLLVLDGFTMLLNAGAERLPAWLAGYVRHYQRIDVVLLSHIAHNNVLGLASCVSEPGAGDHGLLVNHWLVPPPLSGGHDHSEAVSSSVNALQLDLRNALTSLVQLSKAPCCNVAVMKSKGTGSASSGAPPLGKPMLIFHKIGYGSLELLTLCPSEDDGELKRFSADWKKIKPDGHGDLNDVAAKSLPSSAAVLLLWKPSNPRLPVKRVLYIGWKCASFKKLFPGVVAGLCASQDCLKQHEYVPAEGLHAPAVKKQAPHHASPSAGAAKAAPTADHGGRKVPAVTAGGAAHVEPSAPMSVSSKEAPPATHKPAQTATKKTDRPTTATTKSATSTSAGAATQHGQQKRPQTTPTATTPMSGSNVKDKVATDSKKTTSHTAGKAAASAGDTKKSGGGGGGGTTKKHGGETARPASAQHASKDDKKHQSLAKTTKKEVVAKTTVPVVVSAGPAAATAVTNGLPTAPAAEPVRVKTDQSDADKTAATTDGHVGETAPHEEPQEPGLGAVVPGDIDSEGDGPHLVADEMAGAGKLVAIGTVECAITEHGEADFCDDTPEELSADQMRQLGLYDDEEENALDGDSQHAVTKAAAMPTANGGHEHVDEDRYEEDDGVEDENGGMDDDSGHAGDGTAVTAAVATTDMSHLSMEGSFYGKDVVSMDIENEQHDHGPLEWEQQPLALPMPARGPAVDSASGQMKKNAPIRSTAHVDCLCVPADMEREDLRCLFEAVRARHVIVQDGGTVAGDPCKVLEALLEEAERDAGNASSGGPATAITSVVVSLADAQVLTWIHGNSARLQASRIDVSDIDLDHRTITVAIGDAGSDGHSDAVSSEIADSGDVTEDGHTCRGMRLDL